MLSLVGLLVCTALAVFVLLREPPPPPFSLLHPPVTKPLLMRDRLARWVPSSWTWVPRLQDKLFGRRKPINVYPHFFALPESNGQDLCSSLGLAAPNFSHASGLQAWLIPAREFTLLREGLNSTPGVEVLNHPRISTADGIEASIFVGESILLNGVTNAVGLQAGFFPRARDRATDLFTAISLSELVTNAINGSNVLGQAYSVSIRTNLAIEARAQVPNGTGLLLLDGKSAFPPHKRFGFLIEP